MNSIRDISVILELNPHDFWDDAFFLRSSYTTIFRQPDFFSSSRYHGIELSQQIPEVIEKVSMYVEGILNRIDINDELIQQINNKFGTKEDHFFSSENSTIKKITQNIAIDMAIARFLSDNERKFESNNYDIYQNLDDDRFLLMVISLDLLMEKGIIENPELMEQASFWRERLKKSSIRMKRIFNFLIETHGLLNKNEHNAEKYSIERIISLKRRICRLKIRLLEANEDYIFLSDYLGILSNFDDTSSIQNSYRKNIVRRVIIEKRLSHADGRSYFSDFQHRRKLKDEIEILQNATELAEFNEVLNSILGNSQWSLL